MGDGCRSSQGQGVCCSDPSAGHGTPAAYMCGGGGVSKRQAAGSRELVGC